MVPWHLAAGALPPDTAGTAPHHHRLRPVDFNRCCWATFGAGARLASRVGCGRAAGAPRWVGAVPQCLHAFACMSPRPAPPRTAPGSRPPHHTHQMHFPRTLACVQCSVYVEHCSLCKWNSGSAYCTKCHYDYSWTGGSCYAKPTCKKGWDGCKQCNRGRCKTCESAGFYPKLGYWTPWGLTGMGTCAQVSSAACARALSLTAVAKGRRLCLPPPALRLPC